MDESDEHTGPLMITDENRAAALERLEYLVGFGLFNKYAVYSSPGFLWPPRRTIDNTTLGFLTCGSLALMTLDRMDQIPKSGQTVLRMLCVMEEAKIALKANSSRRQRYIT